MLAKFFLTSLLIRSDHGYLWRDTDRQLVVQSCLSR